MEKCLLKCSVDQVPESVNHIWRAGGRGQMYKTAKAKAWQALMTAAMINARKYPTYDGPVKMILRITRRTKRRYDIDNRIKTVQDCLAPAGIILDDAQIVDLHCQKIHGDADLCEVEIWTVEN